MPLRKEQIIKNLHRIEREDPLIHEISGSIGATLDDLDAKIQDLVDQLDIDKATWGLAIYEKELGIKTDINRLLSDRRSVIKSKMRGTGKVDALLIKITADAYTNGEVDVGFDSGAISIHFTSVIGKPPNLNDLKNVLETIKPAHLRIEYVFKYLTIAEVNNMTIDQINNTLIDDLA